MDPERWTLGSDTRPHCDPDITETFASAILAQDVEEGKAIKGTLMGDEEGLRLDLSE